MEQKNFMKQQKSDETQALNIIILPDEYASCKAVELAAFLEKKFEMDFSLADRHFVPHMTIYQACYPKQNYEKIKSCLSSLVKDVKPFELKLRTYAVLGGSFPSWMIASKSNNLHDLHMNVVKSLNGLRERLLLPHIKPDASGSVFGSDFTKEERENTKKYGFTAVDRLYNPHITLGKTKHPISAEYLSKVLPAAEANFSVAEICIGRMENTPTGTFYGTVLEILDRFKFYL